MTPPQAGFDAFYDSHVAAHRRISSRDQIWDRLSQPSVLLTLLLLLGTVLYNAYGPAIGLDRIAAPLGRLAWDGLVFVTPAPLLDAADNWLNPPLLSRPMLETQPSSTHAAKSEAMRRVLGLDRSGGMMASVFKARSRALSATGSVLGLKLDADRPAGLGNRDNSCYQNSILQSLSALRPMPDYLLACLRTIDDEGSSRDVAQTLQTLISDLNDTSNNGKTLWTPGLLKSMSSWTQQDAQEYYSRILDDIEKGVAKATKASSRQPGFESESVKDETAASQHSDDSGYQSQSSSKASDLKLPRNPLEGLLAQRVSCVQCGHSDGLSMIPFNCLTLSLGLDKNQHDLYERLDSYTKVEAIEGVDCPKCTLLKAQRLLTRLVDKMREGNSSDQQLAEPLRRLGAVEEALEEDDFDNKTIEDKCKVSGQGRVSTTKTKQIVVARPPQSLAVHMQRSVFDPTTFNMMKNSAPVNFPLTLDLGPWCLGSAEDTVSGSDGGNILGLDGGSEEQWVLDPKESMIAGDVQPSRLTGPIYELRAAVTHSGRHENGHYICYRKHAGGPAPPPEPLGHGANTATESVDEDVDGDPSDKNEAETELPKESTGELMGMEWWRLSDHNVSRVDEAEVLDLSPGVFMLFYDCVDPTMVLQPAVESTYDVPEVTEVPGLSDEGSTPAATPELKEPTSGKETAAAHPIPPAEPGKLSDDVPSVDGMSAAATEEPPTVVSQAETTDEIPTQPKERVFEAALSPLADGSLKDAAAQEKIGATA